MTGRDEIRDTIKEWQTDVEVDGGLALVADSHFNSAGQEIVLQVISPKSVGVWGDPEKMADLVWNISRRHCAGLQGSQQMQLSACYGSSGKPVRFLPFLMAGASHVGGPNGLSTEAPNATGAMSQGMRLLEIHSSGNFGMTASLFQASQAMMDKLAARLDSAEKRADDRGAALSTVLTAMQEQAMRRELRSLVIDAARKAIPLLPALVGSTTGLDVGQDVAEASFFDAAVESADPKQLQMMVHAMPGSMGAVAADMLVKAQHRKVARDAEKARAVSYDKASADAAGEAFSALRGKPANGDDVGERVVKRLEAHDSTGHANGHTSKAAPVADSDILTTMLETLSEGEIDQVAAIFASKRPDLPGLANQIKQRHAALKESKT